MPDKKLNIETKNVKLIIEQNSKIPEKNQTRLGIKFWENYFVEKGYTLETKDYSMFNGKIGISLIGKRQKNIFVEIDFCKTGQIDSIIVEKQIGCDFDILDNIDNPSDKIIQTIIDKYSI